MFSFAYSMFTVILSGCFVSARERREEKVWMEEGGGMQSHASKIEEEEEK